MRLFFKRVFDIALSALSLIVFAPLMVCIAAMIRITSPGPVLFRQTRCGLGGRRFMLYKFRSMINEAEQMRAELHQMNELDGPVFKISDDPRITPVGRWLRRFSLDELPQLLEHPARRHVFRWSTAGGSRKRWSNTRTGSAGGFACVPA